MVILHFSETQHFFLGACNFKSNVDYPWIGNFDLGKKTYLMKMFVSVHEIFLDCFNHDFSILFANFCRVFFLVVEMEQRKWLQKYFEILGNVYVSWTHFTSFLILLLGFWCSFWSETLKQWCIGICWSEFITRSHSFNFIPMKPRCEKYKLLLASDLLIFEIWIESKVHFPGNNLHSCFVNHDNRTIWPSSLNRHNHYDERN